MNRKNANGIGIMVMVRKLKKNITPPDSLTMWAALLSDIINRLAFCPDWNKSQPSFFFLSLGSPLEVTLLVKNVSNRKSPDHDEVKGSDLGSSSYFSDPEQITYPWSLSFFFNKWKQYYLSQNIPKKWYHMLKCFIYHKTI